MNPNELARSYATARIGFGVLLLLFPGRLLSDFLGPSTRRTRAVGRMLGARDLVIGIGGTTQAPVRPWVTYAAVSDAVDAVGVVLAYRQLPKWRRAATLLLSAGGAGLGGYLVSQLDD